MSGEKKASSHAKVGDIRVSPDGIHLELLSRDTPTYVSYYIAEFGVVRTKSSINNFNIFDIPSTLTGSSIIRVEDYIKDTGLIPQLYKDTSSLTKELMRDVSVGEKITNKDGESLTVVGINTSNNSLIDIYMHECDAIFTGINKGLFLSGILNKNVVRRIPRVSIETYLESVECTEEIKNVINILKLENEKRYVGQVIPNCKGQKVEIVRYNGRQDIDVYVEGTDFIKLHQMYEKFVRCQIQDGRSREVMLVADYREKYGVFPRIYNVQGGNLPRNVSNVVGEIARINGDIEMEIVKQYSMSNIDVYVKQTGVVILGVSYTDFKRLALCAKPHKKDSYISIEEYKREYGITPILDYCEEGITYAYDYRNVINTTASTNNVSGSSIITGTRVRGKKKRDITAKEACIKSTKSNEEVSTAVDSTSTNKYDNDSGDSSTTINRVGEIRCIKHGVVATVLEDRGQTVLCKCVNPIYDIEKEEELMYHEFNRGAACSSAQPENIRSRCCTKNHRGEVKFTNDGVRLEILSYTKLSDVTISADGKVFHTTYNEFLSGRYPEDINTVVLDEKEEELQPDQILGTYEELHNEHCGEIVRACNGMQMRLERWVSPHKVDVRFADGSVAYNRDYLSFLRGKIANPNRKFGAKYDEDYCEDPAYRRLHGVTFMTEIESPLLKLTSDERVLLKRLGVFSIKRLIQVTEDELKSVGLNKEQYRDIWSLIKVLRILLDDCVKTA